MRVGYRSGPAAVDVETDDVASGTWLTEFLGPFVEIAGHGTGDAEVRFIRSAVGFQSLQRQVAEAPSQRVPCFTLDRRVVDLPGSSDGSGLLAVDAELECVYRVVGRVVEIVALPGRPRARFGLMRVVREILAAKTLARADVLDLHAAAFAVGARAVVLAGPKASGKTTMLAHVLASHQADLVANDRVFIDLEHTPAQLTGVPTLVAVRPDTLGVFPPLRRFPAERPASLCASELDSSDGLPEAGTPPSRPFALTPAQFAGRLGARTARGASTSAIVFPTVSPEADGWVVESMSGIEGAARLAESLYGVAVGPRPRTVFAQIAGPPSPATDQLRLASRLANTLPCLRCRVGTGASRQRIAQWLGSLGLEAALTGCQP